MKHVSKQFAVALMVSLILWSGFAVSAATVVYSPTGAATNTAFSGLTQTNQAGAISQLVIQNPSATANIVVRFIDAPSTTLTYSNAAGAWTNHARTVVQFTNIFTDILGNSETNIYTTVTNTLTGVAAATNNFRSLAQWTVLSNTTLTLPFTTPIQFGSGLLVTNSGAATITINYLAF